MGATTRMLAALILAVSSLCGCGSDGNGGTQPNGVQTYFTGASISGSTPTFHNGPLPTPQGSLTLTVPPSRAAINGGSTTVNIVSSADVVSVFVAVEGVDGYWEVPVPTGVSALQLLLTLAQHMPATEFPVLFEIADSAGNVSEPQAMQTTVHEVGTGDVQVSVSWDANNDVDLHVVDPNGFEIYWLAQSSPEQGELDLDSNAGCAIDGVNNENIRWPTGAAPHGQYTVRVDNFENCTQSAANYVVTVQRAGQPPETHTGSFAADDPGDGGSAGSGVDITQFELP